MERAGVLSRHVAWGWGSAAADGGTATSASSRHLPLRVGACGAVAAHSDEERAVAEAHGRLSSAFRAGLSFEVRWRRRQLRALQHLLSEHRNELVAAVCHDLGKQHSHEVFVSEINVVTVEVEHALEHLSRWVQPESVSTPLFLQPSKSYVFKDPLGVTLIISPWNYPLNLALVPLIGSIAAGNCTFLKLSRHSKATSKALHQLLERYLDPRGLVVESEGGASMIQALTALKWNHIFFTGSCSVGRIVYERAAKFLTPVTLELGGKNPCVIDGSVDMELTCKRVAWGKFFNAGQTCIGVDYVIVPHHLEGAFIEGMRRAIEGFYGANPRDSESFPRIISEYHVQRLAKLLDDGEVVFGGEYNVKEKYFAPTIMRAPKEGSLLIQDEIFGPILLVKCVSNVEEALEYIEERPHPLATYVFTNHTSIQSKCIQRIRCGSIVVNDCLIHFANHNLPFGGVGESGLGSYHGDGTFNTFTHRKSVMMSSTRKWLDVPMKYPPYSDTKSWVVEKVANLRW